MKKVFLLFLSIFVCGHVLSAQDVSLQLNADVSGAVAVQNHSVGGGPSIDVSLGVNVYRYLFVGLGTGVHTCFYPNDLPEQSFLPLYLALRGYYPLPNKMLPYVELAIGGYGPVWILQNQHGFFLRTGIAIDISKFNIGAGYECVKEHNATATNGAYLKVGISFNWK